jgi:hypothetical protein
MFHYLAKAMGVPTTVPGKEFERTVRQLLALSGFEVEEEQILGHKKVDLVASKRELGKIRRYAIECKDHSKPIGARTLATIEADYMPLYERSQIDALLLVTREGLAPAAATSVTVL